VDKYGHWEGYLSYSGHPRGSSPWGTLLPTRHSHSTVSVPAEPCPSDVASFLDHFKHCIGIYSVVYPRNAMLAPVLAVVVSHAGIASIWCMVRANFLHADWFPSTCAVFGIGKLGCLKYRGIFIWNFLFL